MRIVVTVLPEPRPEGSVAPDEGMILVERPGAGGMADRFWDRFGAAITLSGGGMPAGRLPAGLLGYAAPAGRRRAGLALPVLALRAVEVERGLNPHPHPADAEALALLRGSRPLREAWPWLAPCLDAGRFAPAASGGEPSPARIVVARRSPERYAARAWTPERVTLLRRMWEAGALASEIADALGDVSRSAVIGKLNRLGLKAVGAAQANPRRKGGRPTHRGSAPLPSLPLESAGAEA